MKIVKLTIINYERFKLGNVTRLEYMPNEQLCLIVGTNGSGKSSFIRALSLISLERKDFYDRGYRELTIEHNNNVYMLIDHKQPGKYSLLENNVELNPGGTKTVQLELIREYFGITPFIASLLTGETRFSSLPVNKRKEVFEVISNTDYTYILDVYNKLTVNLRDTAGVIKHLENKLSELDSTVVKDKLDELEEVIEWHESILTLAYNKLPSTTPVDTANQADKIYSLIAVLENTVAVEPDISLLNRLENRKIKLTDIIDSKLAKYKEIKQLMDEQVASEALNSLSKQVEQLKSKLPAYITIDNLIPELTILEDNIPYLIEAFRELYNLEYSYFNKERHTIAKLNYTELNDKFNTLTGELGTLRQRISELAVNKELKADCNNCGNTVYYNFNPTEYDKLLNDADKCSKLKDTTEKELNIVIDTINNYEAVYKWLTLVNDIKQKSIVLQNILPNDLRELMDNILFIENKVNTILATLTTLKELPVLDKEYKDKLATYSKHKSMDIDDINKELHTIDNEIIDTRLKLQLVDRDILHQKHLIRAKEQLEENKETLRQLTSDYLVMLNRAAVNDTYTVIQSYISSLKITIKELTAEYNNLKLLATKKDELLEEIKLTKAKLEDYKVLELALSPRKGLIAKSIGKFLNAFIDYSNSIIDKISNYPLSLADIDLTKDALTYRFKVNISNKPINDIQEGSTGQAEVIDTAIKMAIMKFLKLEDILFLDEYGANMDPVNKDRAFSLVDNLDAYNQVYVITHDLAMLEKYTSYDIVILDNTGLDTNLTSNCTTIN